MIFSISRKVGQAFGRAPGLLNLNLNQTDRPLWVDSVENSRPWFPRQKSTRLRVKYLLLAEGSGLKFRVAARKKDVFSRLYAGSLEEPTFSTESVECGCREARSTIGIRTPPCVSVYRSRPENTMFSSFDHGAMRSVAALNLP